MKRRHLIGCINNSLGVIIEGVVLKSCGGDKDKARAKMQAMLIAMFLRLTNSEIAAHKRAIREIHQSRATFFNEIESSERLQLLRMVVQAFNDCPAIIFPLFAPNEEMTSPEVIAQFKQEMEKSGFFRENQIEFTEEELDQEVLLPVG